MFSVIGQPVLLLRLPEQLLIIKPIKAINTAAKMNFFIVKWLKCKIKCYVL